MESSTDPVLQAVGERHGNFCFLLKAESAALARQLRLPVSGMVTKRGGDNYARI